MPFVSAAMDTVTEARLAITIAQEGGIGIIHKNMTAADQAREVGRVKKHESGVIRDPITVRPDATIREVVALTRAKGISGLPVTADGNQVVGIVTHRDIRFEEQLDLPVSKVMTPREKLVTVRENTPREEVLQLLHRHRIEKVLVVDGDGRAARHDHGQGHPEGARFPARLQGRARARCASAPRSEPRRTRSIASPRWWRRASTS